MRVALEACKGERTLSQVAGENGVSPSLAAAWRDEPLGSADDVSGKTARDRERKEQEAAAKRQYDEAPGTIGQPAVERDFLQRFCDEYGYDPGQAAGRGGRQA